MVAQGWAFDRDTKYHDPGGDWTTGSGCFAPKQAILVWVFLEILIVDPAKSDFSSG